MPKNLKCFGGILLAAAIATAIGCSSDSSPAGPGGGPTREFVSPTLNQNNSFEHVFTKAATYNYFCSFHGSATTGMRATITVNAGGAPSKRQSDIVASSLETLTIDVGDTIRWTNLTTMPHNVQSAE